MMMMRKMMLVMIKTMVTIKTMVLVVIKTISVKLKSYLASATKKKILHVKSAKTMKFQNLNVLLPKSKSAIMQILKITVAVTSLSIVDLARMKEVMIKKTMEVMIMMKILRDVTQTLDSLCVMIATAAFTNICVIILLNFTSV